VDDPTDRPTPPPRPERRPRRFHLPREHHDTRTNERIAAFLDGPPRAGRHRRPHEARRRGSNRPIELETTAAWRSALRHEGVRVERYGRPATILVVDVGVQVAGVPAAELAEPVLEAIRNEARETDRAVRVSPTRFHLLLPETGESDAARLAERIREGTRDRLNGQHGMLRLRIEAQTRRVGRSLDEALDEAERRLDY
jgi:hypothetical protein